MQDPTQPSPETRNPSGYRPLVPAGLATGTRSSATLYVFAAAGLGLAVGLGAAFMAGAGHGSATSQAASGAHGSSLGTLPAVYTGPSLLNKVDFKKKAPAGQQILTPAASTAQPAAVQKKHGKHKLWHWKKGAARRDEARRKPYVAPEPAPDQPTALERATAAAASGPFFIGIEGDVTVASYDVADNRIQTYEGSNFILENAGSSAIPWKDYPFNVHYRCDGSGNCTLVRGGATATARMTR